MLQMLTAISAANGAYYFSYLRVNDSRHSRVLILSIRSFFFKRSKKDRKKMLRPSKWITGGTVLFYEAASFRAIMVSPFKAASWVSSCCNLSLKSLRILLVFAGGNTFQQDVTKFADAIIALFLII